MPVRISLTGTFAPIYCSFIAGSPSLPYPALLSRDRAVRRSTPTPSGVGPVHVGDVIEIEIEGVGTLRNPVIPVE